MSAVNVWDNEDLYNVIKLGNLTSPGKVTLSGHDRVVNWDVQAGPFQMGATTRFKSAPPIEFTASFYLTKDPSDGSDDFAKWDAFQKLIDSTVANPQAPAALSIYHPDLARNGISSVVKASTGGMTYDEHGGATVVVKFQEYRPPRKWEGTPVAKPAGPDPNQDLKDRVNRLADINENPNLAPPTLAGLLKL